MGDITELAASIEEFGLLHPVVITNDEVHPRLIAGARRLAACKQLRWHFIDATMVSIAPEDYGAVESAENIQRKNFTPSEMFAVSRELLQRAQREIRDGRKTGNPPPAAIFAADGKFRAKDYAARAVGVSRETLRKIEKVVKAVEDEPGYRDILEAMDETGNVAGALRDIVKRERRKRISAESMKVRAAKTALHDNRLYLADHFRFLEDGSVDLVLADPPYNISQARTIDFQTEDREKMSNNFGVWDWTPPDKFIKRLDKWSREFFRVLRDGGSVYAFSAEPYVSYFRTALINAGFHFKNTLVWMRPNPKPKPDKTSYVATCDFILFAVRGEGHTFNYTKHNDMLSLIKMPPANGAERSEWGYATQKPVKLFGKLVKTSTNAGDLVLDPFAGSGTTGEVCAKLGRRFILVDSDPEAIEIMEARTGVKHEYKKSVPKVY